MANKFKKGFVAEYKSKKQHEAQENRIKQKHHISDENVVVVEKSNTLKFIIRILVLFLKTAAWIILIILAAVGILCLIYPETRAALFDVLSGICTGTETLIGQ